MPFTVFAVIVTLPPLTHVTTPFELTVAIFLFEELHVSDFSVVSAGRMV